MVSLLLNSRYLQVSPLLLGLVLLFFIWEVCSCAAVVSHSTSQWRSRISTVTKILSAFNDTCTVGSGCLDSLHGLNQLSLSAPCPVFQVSHVSGKFRFTVPFGAQRPGVHEGQERTNASLVPIQKKHRLRGMACHGILAFISEKDNKVASSSRHTSNDLGMKRILAYREEPFSKGWLHCSTDEPVRTRSALEGAVQFLSCNEVGTKASGPWVRVRGLLLLWSNSKSPSTGSLGTQEAFLAPAAPSETSASLHNDLFHDGFIKAWHSPKVTRSSCTVFERPLMIWSSQSFSFRDVWLLVFQNPNSSLEEI